MAEGHHDDGDRRSLLARVQFEQLRAGLGLVAEQRKIPLDPERRFEIERVIGSGGMGVVYLGYDTKLSRRVALKVVRGHATELSQLEIRLQREARVLATLRDRNVLAIFDIGRARSGELFIATEYVDGPTLREWQKGRPWSEVLPVYIEAGRGLAAAHAMQIVHRDFKPDNVLIEPRSPPRVFVGDFGLASEIGADASTPKRRPRPVQSDPSLLGTLEYMAPEQRACQPATASSDQFAFCVSLWEAWAGSRPCLVDDRPPDRPNRMPRRLHRLLAIGLSPRPEHRHPSLAVLLEQLARDERRQHEHRAIAFVGALLSLSIATSYTFGRRLPAATIEQPPSCQLQQTDEFWNPDVEARLRHHLASHPQRYAVALADVVARLLTANSRARHQLAYETCEQRRSTSDNRLLDQRETCIDRWRQQAAMQIDLLRELGADELEHARELLIPLHDFEAECSASTLPRPLDPMFSHELAVLQNAGLLFQVQRAEELGRAAVELARQQAPRCAGVPEFSREQGHALRLLGRNHRLHGRPDLAVPALLEAIEIGEACVDPELTVDARLELARLQTIDNEAPEVARTLLRSIGGVLARPDGPPGVWRRVQYLEAQGFVELISANPAGAIDSYRRALALLGEVEPYVLEAAKLHENIATAQQEQLDFTAASGSYARARALLVEGLDANHPLVQRLLSSIALNEALVVLSDQEYERASLLLEALVEGPEAEIRAKALSAWLIAHFSSTESQASDELVRARAEGLVALVEASPGLDPRTRAEALSMAGLVVVRTDEELGLAHMRAALDIWVARFPNDENTRALALSLCNELVRVGRFEVARWVLESSRDLTAPISPEARQHEIDLERRIEAKSR